jgi:hypothetical protein
MITFRRLVLFAVFTTGASAQIFFTGALQYYATGSGGDQGGNGEYDTFVPHTGNTLFTVDGNTGFAYALSVGMNTFTLGGTAAGSSFQGIGLFFSDTATTFTGPTGAVPHLVVVDDVAPSTTFSFATGGSSVATFGQISGTGSYPGATIYEVGGYNVTVTTFDFGGSSTLQLSVTAIPEPGNAALLAAVAALGLTIRVRRRVVPR